MQKENSQFEAIPNWLRQQYQQLGIDLNLIWIRVGLETSGTGAPHMAHWT
jgi:hypothetical protein